MAGASMNDIKARMKSVKSTMQITKAMELVATSKLRRAKEKAENTRPFREALARAIRSLEASSDFSSSVWSDECKSKKTLYVVIAGDRGLAGGYNSNVFKLAESLIGNTDAIVLPIGKKALEYYRHTGRNLLTRDIEYVSDVGVGDTLALGELIVDGFLHSDFGSVEMVYTRFVSMMSQIPAHERILPFEGIADDNDALSEPIVEGDAEEILTKIIPQYIGGVLWSAVCESGASEQGARRNSMNSANKNAEEMIGALTLKYNRARQTVITQEIIEIVSGAEAL